jgi:hypothetical protein
MLANGHRALYLIDLAWGATDRSRRVWYQVNVEPRSSRSAKVTVTCTTRESTGPEKLDERDMDTMEACMNSYALHWALLEVVLPHMREHTP